MCLPYADCHPDASGGFTDRAKPRFLQVVCSEDFLHRLPEESRDAFFGILRQDPRPSYQSDPERVYGFSYAGCEVKFVVQDTVLTVTEISRTEKEPSPPTAPSAT